MRYKQFFSREESINQNINKIYGLVIGQCTPALCSTLKSNAEYKDKSTDYDALWLLKKLKVLTAGVDQKDNPAYTIHEQMLYFFNIKQGQGESDNNYLVRFNACARVLEMSGGENMFISEKVLGKTVASASDDKIAKAKKKIRAMCFIQQADEARYRVLLEELQSRVIKGRDEYLEMVAEAYSLMLRTSKRLGYRRNRSRFRNGQKTSGQQNYILAQKGDKTTDNDSNKPADVAGKDGITHEGVRCYSFQRLGHYSSQCLNEKQDKATHTGCEEMQCGGGSHSDNKWRRNHFYTYSGSQFPTLKCTF